MQEETTDFGQGHQASSGIPNDEYVWLQPPDVTQCNPVEGTEEVRERFFRFNGRIAALSKNPGLFSAEYEQALFEALRNFPDHVTNLMRFAKHMEYKSEAEAARSAYKKILAIDPLDRFALQALGFSFMYSGQFEQAIQCANSILAQSVINLKDQIMALAMRRKSYKGLSKIPEAIQDATYIFELQGAPLADKISAACFRISLNYTLYNHRAIVEDATYVIDNKDRALKEDALFARYMRMRSCYFIENFEQAIEDARALIKTPDTKVVQRSRALIMLADGHYRLGDYQATVESVNNVLAFGSPPDHDLIHVHILKTDCLVKLAFHAAQKNERRYFLQAAREACSAGRRAGDNETLRFHEAEIDFYEGNHPRALKGMRSLLKDILTSEMDATGKPRKPYDILRVKVFYYLTASRQDEMYEKFIAATPDMERIRRVADKWRHSGIQPKGGSMNRRPDSTRQPQPNEAWPHVR